LYDFQSDSETDDKLSAANATNAASVKKGPPESSVPGNRNNNRKTFTFSSPKRPAELETKKPVRGSPGKPSTSLSDPSSNPSSSDLVENSSSSTAASTAVTSAVTAVSSASSTVKPTSATTTTVTASSASATSEFQQPTPPAQVPMLKKNFFSSSLICKVS
jgi:hypothetical protein